MNNFNGLPKLQTQAPASPEKIKEELEKKRERVLIELKNSKEPFKLLEDILEKDGKNWYVISAVAEWTASMRKPNEIPPEYIEKQEDLLVKNFQKFDPETLTKLMSSGIDKHFDSRIQALILGAIPFNKLNISPEQKKRISASAINLIQNNNLIFGQKDNLESPATLYAIRAMSKSGILDYTQFLSPDDAVLISEKLKAIYFDQNKRNIEEYFLKKQNSQEEKGPIDYSDPLIVLSEQSKQEIKKYFGDDNFSVNFKNEPHGWHVTSNQIGYSSFFIGKKNENKNLVKSMSAMVIRSGTTTPANDLRLNLNFNSQNYEKISEIAAGIIAHAQLHGVQIASKFAEFDLIGGQKIHDGRIMFYVDEVVAKFIVDYLKKNKFISSDIKRVLVQNNIPTSYFSDGDPNYPFVLRGTGETDNSTFITRTMDKILNS